MYCAARACPFTLSSPGPRLPSACCSEKPDMHRLTQFSLPTLVRVKEGALDRVGIYLSRENRRNVAVIVSQGLHPPLLDRVRQSLQEHAIEPVVWVEVSDNDIESAARLFAELPRDVAAVVGIGGGKALDVA